MAYKRKEAENMEGLLTNGKKKRGSKKVEQEKK